MKKISSILFILIVLASGKMLAKKNDSDSLKVKPIKRSLAINISDPLLKVITKNRIDTSITSFAAPIFYYTQRSKKHLLRIGLQGTHQINYSTSELFTDKKTQTVNKIRALCSYYKQKSITEKFSIQYGLTLGTLLYLDDQVYDSGFDKVNIFSRGVGGNLGPGIVFQYQLNKRLSLFTEYMLLYQYTYTQTGKRFSAFPEENYSNKNLQQFGLQFEYPIAIYLNYHF